MKILYHKLEKRKEKTAKKAVLTEVLIFRMFLTHFNNDMHEQTEE